MTNIEFKNILTAAVAGEHYALEIILEHYSPLINRYSVIDGELDEDLQTVYFNAYSSKYR